MVGPFDGSGFERTSLVGVLQRARFDADGWAAHHEVSMVRCDPHDLACAGVLGSRGRSA